MALVAAVALAGAGAGGSTPGGRALDTTRAIASLGPRPAGERGAERAATELVASRFRALGYRVVFQSLRLPSGAVSRNVVALGGGRPTVVLVAHLDGARSTPAANDNASGVGVLLELARALRGRPGVVLAATAAEERVVTGSRLHLGALRLLRGLSPAARRQARLAVALDMVGVGTRLHVRGIEPRPNRSARLLLAQGGATYLRDRGDSDHAELTRAGFPAAWIQWRPDACWHAPCDRAPRVSAAKLQRAYDVTLRAALAALE